MKPNRSFVGLPKEFWANVRTISQAVGYTVKPKRTPGVVGRVGAVKVPTSSEIQQGLRRINLSATHLVRTTGALTLFGRKILEYFEYRADALNRIVEPLLMNADEARILFEDLRPMHASTVMIPMNKQSNEKKKPAYFTAIINGIIEANIQGLPCNYNPQALTTITRNQQPFRTLARRIDGAFPGPVDPIAVWEIKEYYYTTTFGSRVADGVYETLLDGMELEELDSALATKLKSSRRPKRIQHLLMIDAHFTWWVKGRSYLCRIMDMLHMGYIDEVLFGREVVVALPAIVKQWVAIHRALQPSQSKPRPRQKKV